MNPYDVLGIDRSATELEIQKAFKRMAKCYHPDLHLSKPKEIQAAMEQKMKDLNNAYASALKNASSSHTPTGMPHTDFNRMYDDLIKNFNGYSQAEAEQAQKEQARRAEAWKILKEEEEKQKKQKMHYEEALSQKESFDDLLKKMHAMREAVEKRARTQAKWQESVKGDEPPLGTRDEQYYETLYYCMANPDQVTDGHLMSLHITDKYTRTHLDALIPLALQKSPSLLVYFTQQRGGTRLGDEKGKAVKAEYIRWCLRGLPRELAYRKAVLAVDWSHDEAYQEG